MIVSVVIRTFNEARYLGKLLLQLKKQKLKDGEIEIVVVDSGSTDGTVAIAELAGAKIVSIKKENFTFGRSLNVGCREAQGDVIAIVSGHCIPVDEYWLEQLVRQIVEKKSDYCYGRQVGGDETIYSEAQIFSKYFPEREDMALGGCFCNNANAAIAKESWMRHGFDEELTGLEDMHLARKIIGSGGRVSYVVDAAVYHLHSESWTQICRRFQREAVALREIHPEVILWFGDFLRYFIVAVFSDLESAVRIRRFRGAFRSVIMYRFFQFWGSYIGHKMWRKTSKAQKEAYYYPRRKGV